MNGAGDVLFFVYEAPIAYNVGVALLSALLKQAGFQTSLFVGNGNLNEWKQLLSSIPVESIVCFSHVIKKDFELSLPYVDHALDCGFTVVFGGTYHRRNNDNQYDGRVLICRGDGEELVNYAVYGNESVFNEPKVFTDLNSLPLPDYALFKNHPYNGHIQGFKPCVKLPYNTSRGCIGSCSFCEVQAQYKVPRIRTKVKEDVEYLKVNHEFDVLFITDELCPYYSKEWRDSWGDLVTPFFAFIRADITEEQLEWMISHGMVGCAFGVESGDEEFRNTVMRKGVTDLDILRTVGILRAHDVYYAPFFMIKYPGETFQQKLATHKMARQIGGAPMIFEYTPVVYHTRLAKEQ